MRGSYYLASLRRGLERKDTVGLRQMTKADLFNLPESFPFVKRLEASPLIQVRDVQFQTILGLILS